MLRSSFHYWVLFVTLDNGSKPGIAVPAVRYGMEYGSIARGMVGGARRAKRGAVD